MVEDDPLLCVNTYDPDVASESDSDWSGEDEMVAPSFNFLTCIQIPLTELGPDDIKGRLKTALKELKSTQKALEDATLLISKLREVNISLIGNLSYSRFLSPNQRIRAKRRTERRRRQSQSDPSPKRLTRNNSTPMKKATLVPMPTTVYTIPC